MERMQVAWDDDDENQEEIDKWVKGILDGWKQGRLPSQGSLYSHTWSELFALADELGIKEKIESIPSNPGYDRMNHLSTIIVEHMEETEAPTETKTEAPAETKTEAPTEKTEDPPEKSFGAYPQGGVAGTGSKYEGPKVKKAGGGKKRRKYTKKRKYSKKRKYTKRRKSKKRRYSKKRKSFKR